MLSVTAEKLRSSGRMPKRRRKQAGYLVNAPEVGSAMILFREDTGRQLVTTPVVRLMAAERILYIETENSLYRITVHGRLEFENHEQRFVPIATRELSLSVGASS